MNELHPLLYLKGISTNDFVEALTPLVGEEAKNLSPGVISRLKSAWEDEYNDWRKRDLSRERYVYFWVDVIHWLIGLPTAYELEYLDKVDELEGLKKCLTSALRNGSARKSMEKATMKIALSLIEEGAELKFIAKVTELKLAKLKQLKENTDH